MRLLIIEDEEDLVSALTKALRKQGYAVDAAMDGQQGHELVQTNEYDLLILDLNLPDIDGLELCSFIRAGHPLLPILILTAHNSPGERVTGLDRGADDYLGKPFHLPELMARVRALLRRDARTRNPLLQCANLTLDPPARTAYLGDQPLELTTKEFGILEYLMRHQGHVISQQELLEHVWDASANIFTNTVRVHVTALRHKLGDTNGGPHYIETVVGSGYRLSVPSTTSEQR